MGLYDRRIAELSESRRSRRVTDRRRPFRLRVTSERLHGHHRGRIKVRVRLRGGKVVTLRAKVRGLC